MTVAKQDLEFVLAGLDIVEKAMQHGNMFAAGVAFAEMRQSVRRAIETPSTIAPDASGIDASTTLDQQQKKEPEPARERRNTKRASPGV